MAITPIYIDGFEHGIISTGGSGMYTSAVGTVALDTTTIKSGSRSLHLSAATSVPTNLRISGFTSSPTKMYLAGHIWAGSGGTDNRILWDYVAGINEITLRWMNAGHFNLNYWTGAADLNIAVGSVAASADAWHWVEILWDASTNPHTFQWYVDGTAEPTPTSQAFAATSLGRLDVGHPTNSFIRNDYFDNLIIGSFTTLSTDVLTEQQIIAYSPNGVGTHNLDASPSQFFFKRVSGIDTALTSTETTSYQTFDEVPIASDSDEIRIAPVLTAGSQTDITPDSIAAQSGWSTTITAIDEDPDSPSTDWATAPNNNTTCSVRVTFPTPTGNPTSLTADAYVRKNSASGTGTPTLKIDLYENGSLVQAGSTQNVTSTTGQKLSQSFSSFTLSDPTGAGLELLVTGGASGGSPSARASVDLNAVNIASLSYTTATQPSNTTYAAYTFQSEGTITSAPTTVRAIVVPSLDTATSSTWVAKLYDSVQGTNTEDIYNATISSTATTYRSKVFTQRPNSGGSWTLAALNGLRLRFGYSNSVLGVPHLEGAILEAAFPLSSGGGATTNPLTLTASATSAALTVNRIGAKRTASAASSAAITRSARKALSATASATASAVKRTLKSLAASVSTAASIASIKIKLLTLSASVNVTTGSLTLLDDFNRADGAMGSNWDVWDIYNAEALHISSNHASGVGNPSGEGYGFWAAESFDADQGVQLTIVSADIDPYIGLRIQNPTDRSLMTAYIWVPSVNVGFDEAYLFKYEFGSTNQVHHWSTGVPVVVPGDVVKATAIGDTHTLYINDVQVAQWTDSSYNQPGYIGVAELLEFDDFTGGSLTSTTLTKGVGKRATASVSASVIKPVIVRALKAASATPTATKQLRASISKAASATATASLVKGLVFLRLLTASVTSSASMVRRTARTVATSVTTSATRRVRASVTRSASVTPSATRTRRISTLKTASVSTAASLVRSIGKRLSASATVSAFLDVTRLVTAYELTLTASVAATTALSRAVSKALTASVSATGVLYRLVAKPLSAAVLTTTTFVRDLAVTIAASVGIDVAVLKSIPVYLAASVSALASWTFQKITKLLPSKVYLSEQAPTVDLTDAVMQVSLVEVLLGASSVITTDSVVLTEELVSSVELQEQLP